MITVFTPCYNRAHTIERLYHSLVLQTNKNFEWIIVDDGSTDNTEQIVNVFIKESNDFPICYFKKENGGKHTAINFGVQKANGEAFFIVDSDDWLPKNAIDRIIYYFDQIKNKKDFAGICGNKMLPTKEIIGKTFDGEVLDITALERKKFNIIGDKAEVFKTEILKKFPFPVFENERFLSEGIVWNRIAFDGYKLRFFNENIYYGEYLNDGLTKNLRKMYRENPVGYLTYISQETVFLQINVFRKYNWFGKAISTVDVKLVGKDNIKKILSINEFEYFLSKLIYAIYSFVRKQ